MIPQRTVPVVSLLNSVSKKSTYHRLCIAEQICSTLTTKKSFALKNLVLMSSPYSSLVVSPQLIVGPTELHSVPATTTHMYGWWMKEDALRTQPWTHTERRPHVNSEMTRYD